jgi:hypothetical protein
MASERDRLQRAVDDQERLVLEYRSAKSQDRVIRREVRPEEVTRWVLWVTGRQHGISHIHSFKLERVLSIRRTGRMFRPYSQ